MRVEPGVIMYHEWRDNHRPYRVGPSFWVKEGQLRIWNEPVMELPASQWVRFEVAAGLGEASTGTWELTVVLPNQKPRQFAALKNGSPEWKKLAWLGFSSMAESRKVFYLDNFELANRAQD